MIAAGNEAAKAVSTEKRRRARRSCQRLRASIASVRGAAHKTAVCSTWRGALRLQCKAVYYSALLAEYTKRHRLSSSHMCTLVRLLRMGERGQVVEEQLSFPHLVLALGTCAMRTFSNPGLRPPDWPQFDTRAYTFISQCACKCAAAGVAISHLDV